jgi:branched-chain amino acid transport system ATP-binding protein
MAATEASVGSAPLLEVADLTVGYGPVTALRGVSVRVDAGEIVTVLGPNGAGKTTLLTTIAGVLKPQSGTVTLGSEQLTGLAPEDVVRRGVSLVPEGRHIFTNLTVEDNLVVGGITRRDAAGLRADMERTFEMFPILRERRSQYGGTLSGGEQQQLAIGRALMASPSLILLDEPSLGLAPLMVERIFELIGELRARGETVLLVEQNVHRALEIADRAYVLSVGQVVNSGPASELARGAIERTYLGLAETE